MLNVHIVHEFDTDVLIQLKAGLRPDIKITVGETLPEPADYHVLVAGRPDRDQLTASPNLERVIVPWAGLPGSTARLMVDYPNLKIHNLHHNAPPVAELTLSLLLAAAKVIIPFDRALRAGDWGPRHVEPTAVVGLSGKTALILGYGHIGRLVGRACLALGMNVVGVRRQPDLEVDGVPIHGMEALPELLPAAQALIICLPLTPATKGLVDAAALALLPPGALLVNIGRGPIVDEKALYEALRDGHLGGAGLDVWYNYPEDEAARGNTLPSNYPLYELDNVVLSPHRGGDVDDTEPRRMAELATLLNAAAQGTPVPNEIDLAHGY